MTGRNRIGCWLGLACIGWIGGCGGLPIRKPAQPLPASSNVLDSGPSTRVTTKQTADVQFAIGRTHEEGDRLDEAEAAYRSALAKNSKRADIETRLAIVLDRKGAKADADKHFEKALTLDPKNPDLLCDRGYCFYLRGQGAEAEKALRAAMALAPSHPRSHTNLGLVLAARGESDKALAEFSRAGTDPADSRSNLALALALGGQVDAARDQYSLALKAKPGSASASQGLKVASTVLKAGSDKAKKLPRLPGQPEPVMVAGGSPPAPAATPRTDPALARTSMAR